MTPFLLLWSLCALIVALRPPQKKQPRNPNAPANTAAPARLSIDDVPENIAASDPRYEDYRQALLDAFESGRIK